MIITITLNILMVIGLLLTNISITLQDHSPILPLLIFVLKAELLGLAAGPANRPG